MVISEELDWWVKGHFSSGPVFEFSVELYNQVPRKVWIADGVPITAMDVWDGKKELMSYLFGRWVTRPADALLPDLAKLFASMQHCMPSKVTPRQTIPDTKALEKAYLGTSVRRDL